MQIFWNEKEQYWESEEKMLKRSKIPEYIPTFTEISNQLRINADCLMKEITEHADKEIERIKNGMIDARHKTLSKMRLLFD